MALKGGGISIESAVMAWRRGAGGSGVSISESASLKRKKNGEAWRQYGSMAAAAPAKQWQNNGISGKRGRQAA
jgi:hypothetical protein